MNKIIQWILLSKCREFIEDAVSFTFLLKLPTMIFALNFSILECVCVCVGGGGVVRRKLTKKLIREIFFPQENLMNTCFLRIACSSDMSFYKVFQMYFYILFLQCIVCSYFSLFVAFLICLFLPKVF